MGIHSYQTYKPNLPKSGPLDRLRERILSSAMIQIAPRWAKDFLKRRNKERLYVALFRGPNPDHIFEGLRRRQLWQDPDQIGPAPPAEEPEERKYTWCFLVGPKKESRFYAVPGIRLGVFRDPWHGRWIMERHYEINIKNTGPEMLVRMAVGKILDKQALWDVLFAVHVDEDSPAYRNRAWLFEALEALGFASRHGDIMSRSSRFDWWEIHDIIVSFAGKMAAQGRFEGEYQNNNAMKPAFDLMEGRYIWD